MNADLAWKLLLVVIPVTGAICVALIGKLVVPRLKVLHELADGNLTALRSELKEARDEIHTLRGEAVATIKAEVASLRDARLEVLEAKVLPPKGKR